MATLADIKEKVRRIVKAPSVSQITEEELLGYINNFLLYDFPENLRLFTFRDTLSFYTTPYVDTYETTSTPDAPIREEDPLYNFKNAYISEHDPVYINGTRILFSQSRAEFLGFYPLVQQRTRIATGDGITLTYTGTLSNIPVTQNTVMFTSYDTSNEGIVVTDVPRKSATTGQPLITGDLVWPNDTTYAGEINYRTGVYTVVFPVAPALSAEIYAHASPATLGKPQAILYYNNKFTLRPIPDAVYRVNMECFVRPTELVNDTDYPGLEQHWSYIAWGAAKRIFEDRVDVDSLQMIMPMFKEQEALVQRRTIMQNKSKEVATIYNAKIVGNWWNGHNY